MPFLRIPKKYAHTVADVVYEGREGGWWVYTAPGFYSPMMETGTIHEMTQADTLAEVRNLRPCPPDHCYCGHECRDA